MFRETTALIFGAVLMAAYAISIFVNDAYALNHSSGGGSPPITTLISGR